MASTRANLKTDLRDRIGEPDQATWTTDTSGGMVTQGEVHRYLNRSQSRVCEDCLLPGSEMDIGQALVVENLEVHLVKYQYAYVLPENTIDVLSVLHLPTTGRYRELKQAPIAHIYDGFYPDAERTSFLTHYEVAENATRIIVTGVATSGSNTTCVDSDRTSDAAYRFDTGTAMLDDSAAALAVDDIVENVTDGSLSAIATSGIAASTLTLDGLAGGRRNSFERGDVFRVRQQEANRQVLYVYPVPDAGDETVIETFTGTADTSIGFGNVAGTNQMVAQSFTVDRRTNISAINLYFGATTGTPLGNVEIRIETDSSGPSGTLVSVLSKTALETPTASATNYVEFPTVFAVSANTTYWIVARIPAQSGYYATPTNNYYTWQADTDGGYTGGQSATHNGTSWTLVSANDHFFQLYGIEEAERLVVRRARYPVSMDADTTMMEVPDYAKRAVLWYAEHMVWQKIGNLKKADYAENKYETEIAKVKERLYRNKHYPNTSIRRVMQWLPSQHSEVYPALRGRTRLIEYDES